MVIYHIKNGGNCTSMAEIDSLNTQDNAKTSNNILYNITEK